MKRVLLAASLLLPLQAAAILPYAFSESEMAALPPLCIAKMRGKGADYAAQFGVDWGHMHHYCHGVKYVNRARAYPKDRSTYLRSAKGEYGYVIKHARPDFWFRPQLYLELARVHSQLGETAEAQEQLLAAIAFNRRFEAAYIDLMQVQDRMGARNAALETATEGLRYLPESARLQNAYLERGGKRPFPDPVASTPPPTAPEAEPSAASAQAGRDTAQAEAAAVEQPETESSGTGAGSEAACRFCPPEEIQQRWRESFQPGQ